MSCSYWRPMNVSIRISAPPVVLKSLMYAVRNSCMHLWIAGMCFMLSTYNQWIIHFLSDTFLRKMVFSSLIGR